VARFFRDSSFNPEIVHAVSTVCHDVCGTLGLFDLTDPHQNSARKMIELAETRERGPDAIRQRALASLGVAISGTASSLVQTSVLLCL
jgi:hypothetical protein